MTDDFKPMLAGKFDAAKQRYPALVSPKLDGIRAIVRGGKLLSRKLIEIPNRFVSASLDLKKMEGYDGELIVGEPTAANVYSTTTSGVMSRDGEPDFRFFAFDNVNLATRPFRERLMSIKLERRMELVTHHAVHNEDLLAEYEERYTSEGHEGLMVRDPEALYKLGRSTTNEGGLLKVKRFEDSEALVLQVIEEQHNGNEATKDNLGRTKRSTAKAGKTGKGRAGRLLVRDIHSGVEFEVGTGLTDALKDEWWAWGLAGMTSPRVIKYKFFPVGVKDKPRHPVYLGLRAPEDIS